MNIDSVKEYFSQEYSTYEDEIRKELYSELESLNKLNEYILTNGGKRVRPILTLLAAEACKGELNNVTYACALSSELIHNATLLHDDVVDESDMRRGCETIRKKEGSGVSLLMGDYWLAKAVCMIVDCNAPAPILKAFAQIIMDLSEGELLQMEKSRQLDTSEEDYYKIIFKKTTQLFRSSVFSAATSVDAPKEYIDALEQYTINLGYAFQIKDDILDYALSTTTGKDSLCDIGERKITLPMLMVFSDPALKEKILSLMSQITPNQPDSRKIIEEIASLVIDNGGLEKAQAILDKHVSAAISALEPLPATEAKSYLKEIANYFGSRNN